MSRYKRNDLAFRARIAALVEQKRQRPNQFKVRVYSLFEKLLGRISDITETWRQHFAICSDCGQNRYTGTPCVKH